MRNDARANASEFHGRESAPTRHIRLSPEEWSIFHAACENLGVVPTAANFWRWRLGELPSMAAAEATKR